MTEHNSFFNSPMELGTRTALILSALDGEKIDIESMVMLDYALLYSEEFGGPENLHPSVPNHIAETAQRLELMPNALRFLIKRGLVNIDIESNGYFYSSNADTIHFISCLKSNYYKKAWIRLAWIKENYSNISQNALMYLSEKLKQ